MSRKGIIAVFNNGIEFLIGSIILVFVTKSYGIDESGAWIVFITILFMGTKFREGLIQGALMKFSVEVSEKQRYHVYWASILLGLGIEMITGTIFFMVSGLFSEPILKTLLQHYYLMAIPQAMFRMFQFIRQSRLEVQEMLISNALLFLTISAMLVIGYVNRLPLQLIPGVIGFGYGLALIYQLANLKVWKWRAALSREFLPEGYLSFAMNGFLRELFGTLSSRAYIFLTAGLVGYTESALVGIASRYANLIYLPNSAYQGILYPKACSIANSGMIRSMFLFYRRALSWMQAAFIPYVLLLLTVGSMGIVILHGLEYLAAIPFFTALILAGAFISPYGHAFGSVCQAAGRPELVTRLVLINSFINLFLSVLLIQIIGVWGAVMSGIMTDVAGLFLISYILKKEFKTTLFESHLNMFRRFISLIQITTRTLKRREAML